MMLAWFSRSEKMTSCWPRLPIPPDQGRQGRLVGAETALDIEGVLDALEGCQPPLELDVQRLRAGDGADGGRPHAPLLDGPPGGLLHAGMVGQAQVVVGAKVEHLLAVHDHPGIGRRAHDAQVDEQPCLLQAGYLLTDEIKLVCHQPLLLS
jgi:hypothetical protein